MLNRACGVYQTTYEGDMALYPLPLARASAIGALVLLVLLPLAVDSHQMALINLMVLASIGAIGLNILVGYTGQVSLGQGAFMMVGSYTAALVTLRLGAPFWVGLLAGLSILFASGGRRRIGQRNRRRLRDTLRS